MRISDWSSDVCSSDLPPLSRYAGEGLKQRASNSPSPAQREREARSAGVRARLLLHTNSHAHPTTPSPQPLSRSAVEGVQPPMRYSPPTTTNMSRPFQPQRPVTHDPLPARPPTQPQRLPLSSRCPALKQNPTPPKGRK